MGYLALTVEISYEGITVPAAGNSTIKFTALEIDR